MNVPRALRRGRHGAVDAVWALYEVALLAGELLCDAGIAVCRWWLSRRIPGDHPR